MVLPGISRMMVGLVLLFCTATTCTATVFVDCGAPPGGDGTSWATAFQRIQSGLSAASSGNNEVWVARGTYMENVTLRTGIRLYGGFVGTEVSLSARNPAAHTTTIDGNQAGNTVVGANNAVIDGFTITNGKPSFSGGGVYCAYTSPTISNCRIAENAGSGVYCYQATPTITNCEITGNTDKGIYCYFGGNATITDCTIAYNSAANYAGIYCSSAAPTIRRCVIAGNYATGTEARGGGLGFTSCSSTVIVENCLIADNRAPMGAGVYSSMSSPSFVNCTIADNQATMSGANVYLSQSSPHFRNTIIAFGTSPSAGAIRKDPSDNPTFVNCDFWHNGDDSFDPTGWYPPNEPGCIAMDPLFVDRSSGNYRLSEPSFCIDGGTNESAPPDDLDGNPRPTGNRTDIGAYEFSPAVPLDSIVEVKLSADGAYISVADTVVTRAFDGYFYIEQTDRTSGMRVQWPGAVTPGRMVSVKGTLETRNGIERQIRATSVTLGDPASVEPVGMLLRSLVGSHLGYDPGPPASGQMGMAGGFGPNNVGLLVRVWGLGMPSASVGFGLEDGSGRCIQVQTPNGVAIGAEGRLAQVTGVCSIYPGPDGPAAVLLVSEASDVVLLD